MKKELTLIAILIPVWILIFAGIFWYNWDTIKFWAANKERISKDDPRVKNPNMANVKVLLEKFPAEAQEYKLTKACQEAHKEAVMDRGIPEEYALDVVLPICTCIANEVKQTEHFDEIEAQAAAGVDYKTIMIKNPKVIMYDALPKCSKLVSK